MSKKKNKCCCEKKCCCERKHQDNCCCSPCCCETPCCCTNNCCCANNNNNNYGYGGLFGGFGGCSALAPIIFLLIACGSGLLNCGSSFLIILLFILFGGCFTGSYNGSAGNSCCC